MDLILKYRKAVAVFSSIGWLAFIFSAFRGFQFWYSGFVFFLWLSLALINYEQETSFWFLKNKFLKLAKFYLLLVVLAFFVDFILGHGKNSLNFASKFAIIKSYSLI